MSEQDKSLMFDTISSLAEDVKDENLSDAKKDVDDIMTLTPPKHLAEQLRTARMDITDGNVYDAIVDVKNIQASVYDKEWNLVLKK